MRSFLKIFSMQNIQYNVSIYLQQYMILIKFFKDAVKVGDKKLLESKNNLNVPSCYLKTNLT